MGNRNFRGATFDFDNEALGDIIGVIGTDGKVYALRTNPDTGRLIVETGSNITPSGATDTEAFRDDVNLVFSAGRGASDIRNLLEDAGSTNGTVSHDATEGRAVFSTGAAASNTVYYQSTQKVSYRADHQIKGAQTIEISRALTGSDEVRWGYGLDDGAGDIDSGIGWGADANGVFYWRRKNGTDVTKTYSTDFSIDPLDGSAGSRFSRDGSPEALDVLNNNLYVVQFSWLGISSPELKITAPGLDKLIAHREETPNSGQGTTVPDPEMNLFVRAVNASGTDLQVASGSWRGGLAIGETAIQARQPDGEFVTAKADGEATREEDTLGSGASVTTAGIDTDGWGSAEVYIATDQESVGNGVSFEFTDDLQAETPVWHPGPKRTFSDDDVTNGFAIYRVPVAMDGMRVTYTNGSTAQGSFLMVVTLRTDIVNPQSSLDATVSNANLAVMTRGAITAPNDSDTWLNIFRSSGTKPGLRTSVSEHEAETPIRALDKATVNQTALSSGNALQVDSGQTNRRSVSVKALDANNAKVYVGFTAGVTNNTGWELQAGDSVDLELDETVAIYVYTGSTGQRVSCIEVGEVSPVA